MFSKAALSQRVCARLGKEGADDQKVSFWTPSHFKALDLNNLISGH